MMLLKTCCIFKNRQESAKATAFYSLTSAVCVASLHFQLLQTGMLLNRKPLKMSQQTYEAVQISDTSISAIRKLKLNTRSHCVMWFDSLPPSFSIYTQHSNS